MKADQWRNLLNVLPPALFAAWQINGKIPDTDAPRPRANTKAAQAESKKENLLSSRRQKERARDKNVVGVEEMQGPDEEQTRIGRSYTEHYKCVLKHCSSIRIYATRSITPSEITRAGQYHSSACRGWARMNCHLTPNFHLSEHNPTFLLAYGPPYGYWGYPMEQHNGFLKKFHHNGHGGGELEATLMRGWIKYSLVSDLVSSCYAFVIIYLFRLTTNRYHIWNLLRILLMTIAKSQRH